MRELTEWWNEWGGSDRKWLLIGKGPTFAARDQYDLSPYTTLAINHVVREIKTDVASCVNYDVVGECGDALYENCRYLLMPRYPHTIPGDAPFLLETYFDRYPVLARLSDEGRLVWYNLSSDTQYPGSPAIQNCGFSVGILFNLLGQMGARHLRTLGVDGGQAYAQAFSDMGHTRLANGMKSYDYQFQDMMTAVKRHNINYEPLRLPSPLQSALMFLRTPARRKYVWRFLTRYNKWGGPDKKG